VGAEKAKPGGQTAGLEVSLSDLVRQPAGTEPVERIRRIVALVDVDLRWEHDMQAELEGLEPFLKDEGNWYKGLDKIAKSLGRNKRKLLRLLGTPTVVAGSADTQGEAQGDLAANSASSLPGKSGGDAVTDEVKEEAKKRAGRRIKFAQKPDLRSQSGDR